MEEILRPAPAGGSGQSLHGLAGGRGGHRLRPGAGRQDALTLFGTANQLLAGLTLLTVSVFLFKLGGLWSIRRSPMALMLSVSIVAMVMSIFGFWQLAEMSQNRNGR